MEKRNEQFGQDGREHGWCSSKYPQGVAKAYLQCLFFFAYVFQNTIHSKAQRKCWPHAVQQKAAGWRRNLMQIQIQSKWMRRPHTQNFNWRFLKMFLFSFEYLRNWNLRVDATIQTAQTLSSTSTWPWAPKPNFKIKTISCLYILFTGEFRLVWSRTILKSMSGVFMESKADILNKGIQGFCEIT